MAVSVLVLLGSAGAIAQTAPGTKENPLPISLGENLTGRLDDNSPRSWGNRLTYYRLSALTGQTIVIGYDCNIEEFYGCIYSSVIPEKSLGFQVEFIELPQTKTSRYTLRRDNPLLKVWSTGTINYTLVVLDGVAGENLWANAKAARARYDQAVALKKAERSAERAAVFGAVVQGLAQGSAEAINDQQQARDALATPSSTTSTISDPVAAEPAAPRALSSASPQPPIKTAHVSCVIRDNVEKRTYYSLIENLAFPLDRVARKNAAFFKEFVVANHGARADLTFLHCDYSFDDRASLEKQHSTNKAIDGRTGFATVQTSWSPQPVE
jgi:hypothetical protein